MDSTLAPGSSDPDRPESTPAWFLALVLVLFLLGMVWVMVTFGGGRALCCLP